MTQVVQITEVSKVLGGKEIVSNLSMSVQQGEIYGFLGQNGAGKTTTLRMIANLIRPTSGRIELFGEQLTATSYDSFKRIGSLLGYPILYENLSARENLEIHCEYLGFYDQKAIQESLALTRLEDTKTKPVKHFSLGMKLRLAVARAICTKPELLILDEPVNGLDPVGIQEQRELLRMLNREYGITIIVSSHILQEIEQVADRIGVIHNGQMKKEVSMSEVQKAQSEYTEVDVTDSKKAAFILEEKMKITDFKVMGNGIIRIYQTGVSTVDIAKNLVANDIGLKALNKQEQSLEEYFLNMIQGE